MQTEDWTPCIVTIFDIVGTKTLATKGLASHQMIRMREVAVQLINTGLPLHSHGYVWNDSVLLLSHNANPPDLRLKVLSELSDFKRQLEQECSIRTYAIAVKGLAFPHDIIGAPPIFQGQVADQPRAVVLKTSSWAMANCFLIEQALGRHRADWYIDNRVSRQTGIGAPFASEKVALLPKNDLREIHMYKGSLPTTK